MGTDTSEWTSRTLFIHNIMQEMDEAHIKQFLNTDLPYEFRSSIKPNQLYILFDSPAQAKQVFYNIAGKRKIDNGGQACVKLLFHGEYKTVIRCTNPDPFPMFPQQQPPQQATQMPMGQAAPLYQPFDNSSFVDAFNSPLTLSQQVPAPPTYYEMPSVVQQQHDYNFYLSQPVTSSPVSAAPYEDYSYANPAAPPKSAPFDYTSRLATLRDDEIIVYPASSLATLQRVSTYNFKRFPAVFSHQHLDAAPETKATLVTGFLRDAEDRRTHISAPSLDASPPMDHQLFYFWCYEKSTPTLHLAGNASNAFFRERCGRLAMLILTSFAPDNSYAIGSIQFFSGSPLDASTITRCILLSHQVFHSSHFPRDLAAVFDEWIVPPEEERRRVDLTHLAPITIDPPSSSDLDDALSFRMLEERHEGHAVFEIGIHISDVSYFLDQHASLDREAEFRLHSIYLVGAVIPMLPAILSSNTCSLKVHQRRLCFSLLVKVRSDGKVLDNTFCRSYLRSLGHMSYERAQRVIGRKKELHPSIANYANNQPSTVNTLISNASIESILEEGFSPITPQADLEERISQSVWGLYLVSSLLNNIRRERGEIFDIGSNIHFELSVDGTPFQVDLLPKLESHVLVQEYMHLANNLAALSLLKNDSEYGILYSPCSMFTDISILPSDDWRIIKQKVEETIKHCTYEQGQALRRLTIHLMDPTRYLTVVDKLGVGVQGEDHTQYTHFTAPIRRYMDVNIHRVLSLQLTKRVDWAPDCTIEPYWVDGSQEYSDFRSKLPTGPTLNGLCQRYNEISWKRKISEKLNTLYLALYLWEHGPILTPAVIIAIPSKHLIIYLVDYNMEVSCDKNDFDESSHSPEDALDIGVSKQLEVFLSVEPFVLFRNGLIPKVRVSKHPPFPI
eukprot:gene7369-8583_t